MLSPCNVKDTLKISLAESSSAALVFIIVHRKVLDDFMVAESARFSLIDR